MNVMRSKIDVLLSNITNAKIDVDELIRNSVWVRHTFRHGKARLGLAWLGLGEVGAAWGGSAQLMSHKRRVLHQGLWDACVARVRTLKLRWTKT